MKRFSIRKADVEENSGDSIADALFRVSLDLRFRLMWDKLVDGTNTLQGVEVEK